MADITKDSFNAANQFLQVVFQKARDACDYELNELQQILRSMVARASRIANGDNITGDGVGGFLTLGTGANNQVTVKRGNASVQGIPISLAADLTVTGFTTNTSGSTKYDALYITISEVEVADPNLTPQLGETTRRRQLQWSLSILKNWDKNTNPIPLSTVNSVLEGGTYYNILAIVRRLNGVAAIGSSDVSDISSVNTSTPIYGQSPGNTIQQIVRSGGWNLVGTGPLQSNDGTTGITSLTLAGSVSQMLEIVSSSHYDTYAQGIVYRNNNTFLPSPISAVGSDNIAKAFSVPSSGYVEIESMTLGIVTNGGWSWNADASVSYVKAQLLTIDSSGITNRATVQLDHTNAPASGSSELYASATVVFSPPLKIGAGQTINSSWFALLGTYAQPSVVGSPSFLANVTLRCRAIKTT